MSLSTPFIHRPVGTTLLTIAIGLAGAIAYPFLPVAPLPQVDYPVVSVNAGLPGASPETMASSVATPLEREFGRIAGITEMTSQSNLGRCNVTLQFDLSRDINAAARDVQAAINASLGNLPANLPSRPTYQKVNPADAPIMILTLTSDTYGKAEMYNAASTILAQKLSQVDGVGQVFVGGGALPAVRVDVNPTAINAIGLGLEDVRNVLASANANRPKGQISNGEQSLAVAASDQLLKASQYKTLLLAYRNGSAVRLSDIANVTDSVEDIHTTGLSNGNPAVLLIIRRQPGANIIDTVDRVVAMVPQLQAEIPAGMKLAVGMDRTSTIRASVHDVQISLSISMCLVVLVVFLFLRSARSTFIPAVAVPVSLIGTLGVMYLIGFSIDNLSLMAMTVATGFVVDDAIVVIENVTRHLEQGMKPMAAALQGAGEIGFTVLSMSTSLVAVFIPILLMGGYMGRLFREFAVTLSTAIGISMVISLTATPMMCAVMLRGRDERHPGWLYQLSERGFQWVLARYKLSLAWVLRHQPLVLCVTLTTIVLTIALYFVVPWDLFPQQDTGRMTGQIIADQAVSAQAMGRIVRQFATVVSRDPDVDGVLAYAGGGGTLNNAFMFVILKPIGVRKLSVIQVRARATAATAHIPGATLSLQAVQDVRAGGRGGSAQYQYTLQGEEVKDLILWAPQVTARLQKLSLISDVLSDQQDRGLESELVIDRETASRMGITPQVVDNVLYDAFGQRQVSTMYVQFNQYHVVLDVQDQFWQNPDGLKYIYVPGKNGQQVPLSAFCTYKPSNTALSVNHSGQFPSITISFNLKPGVALGDAVTQIQTAQREMGLPASIHGNFAGTAQMYQAAIANMPILALAAILSVFIVLGILYESYIHPITILSTIPSAGVGALLALLFTQTPLTMIAFIGIILLIGIVKKNAIMMIDFALDAERNEHKTPTEAIFQAALLRFRPIMMTTMAAMLGGLPLALGHGNGAELRRPLGMTIVGGLAFSQILTLYTTPVVYLYLDRFRLAARRYFHGPDWKPELETVPG